MNTFTRALGLAVAALCLIVGSCSLRGNLPSLPVMHGPVAVAPTQASGGTSSTINDLIAQQTAAKTAGNNKLASALKGAIFETSTQENVSDTNSSMRFFMGISVIIIGLGVGICVFGMTKIGLSVMGVGGGMIGAALLIQALIPFLLYIAIGALVIALLAGLWVLHVHWAAAKALATNNGISTDPHVTALIAKLKAGTTKSALETDVTKVEADAKKL
jgi:hypothetical protein